MAATVEALIARGGNFACLWAGDSRAYRAQGDTLQALTRDHSVVQNLLDSGAIAAAEAGAHPEALDLDKVTGAVRPGDRFLLCSDGVWKALAAEQIAALLHGDADAAKLTACALEQAADDNVTAVTISFGAC